jgi:type I restriction enzyme R subunit
MTVHREIAFEDAIERAMRGANWHQGQPANYRRELGLDTAMLIEFLGATQAEQWERLITFSGGDRNGTEAQAFRPRIRCLPSAAPATDPG